MASYTYACKDYPGMDSCPGTFESQAQDELWKHIELHAAAASQEDPSSWPCVRSGERRATYLVY